MRAEVVAGLERLPAPERDEPQEFPASATDFSQRPLPGSLRAKSTKKGGKTRKLLSGCSAPQKICLVTISLALACLQKGGKTRKL